MKVAQLALGVLVAVVLAAATATAPAVGDRAVFPFVKGTTWTYAGTVKWTNDRNQRRSGTVRWTSEVVDAFDDGDVAAALLKGGVWDLAWWEPGARAGSYVLLRVGTRYYRVCRDPETVFFALKGSGRKALPPNLGEKPWFEAPLKPGRLYRPKDVAPRDDTMYGWLIASTSPVNVAVTGMESARSAYVLSYRTLPDEETLTLVPGVGITSFAYVHHGTIAEADVHLVAYHRGGPK
jgi:hypothetical protein